MFSTGKESISLSDILNKASEFDILSYYLGITKIPIVINSPLRTDNRPSFGIYSANGFNVLYKDFSTGESGNIFNLLSKIWNKNYHDTLVKIYHDMDSCQNKSSVKVRNNHNRSSRHSLSDSTLQCKVRDWKSHDIQYWNTFGISLKMLKYCNVHPISHIIIQKNEGKYTFPAEKYAYCYVERKDNKVSLKIYQPFSKTNKWMNKHDASVWDLWDRLPKNGNDLIITSSRKDAMCIWENTRIPACSLQAESYIPKEKVINELKSRFKNIYVLYDNDYNSEQNHGRILGNKLATKFGLIQIEIPSEYESKDSSDLYKNKGKQCLQEVITKLINDNKQQR